MFVKSQVPNGTAVKLTFQYQKVKEKQVYTISLGENSVLTCIGEAKAFVFETSEGLVGYIRVVSGTYELSIITSEQELISEHFASVIIERKTLLNRKFSSLTVKQMRWTPRRSFNREPEVRTYRSRDPFLNSEGKLELKVSNIDHVRPSAFNCLLEDADEVEVCSLLHTNSYELIIGPPFSVLLGAACAVARIDWISSRSKE